MATLVLQGADALAGNLLNGAGQAVTGLAGDLLASTLGGGSALSPAPRVVDGPRLGEMGGLASTEGAPIPRLYGRARLGGQLIWATRFEEVVTREATRSPARGAKGFGASEPARTTVTTTYSYFGNFAVGLCEGPIAFVRRVWADGRELDLTTLTMRVHRGSEDQEPDPLIVAKEGAEAAPAYRGLAYAVFERLALAPFGNRVPQFSFEVVRTVEGLPEMIRAVCLIPGATEFGYGLVPVGRDLGLGRSEPENIHQLQRPTDVSASLDALQALCPNLRSVSLVVSWFGDDLRAGACTVAPRVDLAGKTTQGAEWRVAGLTRATAREVSRAGGVAAYGGTPSDASVVGLIQNLKARGLAVTLYPFVMMDVALGNGLPDPRTGAPDQPPYPWRGRITCDPAPGRPGSPDGTAAAAAQVAAFFGTAASAHFAGTAYAGPPEWSFGRHVLHCAALAREAGGVEAFIIGSELVGLTRIRDAAGAYPAVGALRALAAECRAMLGPGTTLTYAADWTEYGSHRPEPGALDWPLDPLWADPLIGAVGIDWYPPLSDWRDGAGHLDLAEASGPADLAYLCDRLGSGEGFDWYYPDEASRRAQRRVPITDGDAGKPWVYRVKDLVGWWSNAHRRRVGGIEREATAWEPGAKPIWLTEIGIPAVDRGANGPNVFPDPKSAESALPPFSRGGRDDLVQARGLEATLSRFDPALPGHQAGWNPLSPAGLRMVDPAHVSVWCWDARPFPAFPDFATVWADGGNHATGHWITGRIEGVPLDRLVAAILAEYGIAAERPALDGFLDGYVIDRPMAARDALEPLARLFGFDLAAGPEGLRFRPRGGRVTATIGPEDLAEDGGAPLLARSRAQETELPASLRLAFTDSEADYARAAVSSHRLAGASRQEES
ncbi:MAG: glycoside hydrolase/phage tail family protein, partial [Methylobacteriaceae bacterium]|nr:glycoside hydrolase/phage tail family protein [Methylobacteriaceae bacterium]